ncbi:hypothetical protein VD0001_g2309 [Verticillium dahliae]|nr:hypothetical protein VD0001_g2309 [Verticillium dahliae]
MHLDVGARLGAKQERPGRQKNPIDRSNCYLAVRAPAYTLHCSFSSGTALI